MRKPRPSRAVDVAELEALHALLADASRRSKALDLEEAFHYLLCAEAVVVERLKEAGRLPG